MMYTDPKTIVPPKNLDELIEELHKVFDSDHVNVEYVTELMASYKSNPKDWKKFAIFDLHRYTRNLVDAGNGKFNLMVLCWNTSQGSAIHDHANAHCFMKVLDGHSQEELFEWPPGSEDDGEMKSKGKKLYERDQVAYISDTIGLHRVENPATPTHRSHFICTLHPSASVRASTREREMLARFKSRSGASLESEHHVQSYQVPVFLRTIKPSTIEELHKR